MREFRRFLKCGIFAHGFLRVYCDSCRSERLVPFSCKGRGFCSSCGGRRMSDTAAHLVDRVWPEAPVRQWVLSLPFALRYRLAYDASLSSAVLRIFVRRVFVSLRRRARLLAPVENPQCGAVTFVQRFGGALNLNVHFHTLVLDGIYDPQDGMRFRPLPPPDEGEMGRVVKSIAGGIARLLERRGLAPDAHSEEIDPLARDEPLLAALYSASVRSRIATGPRAGQAVMRFGDRVEVEDLSASPGECCAVAGGISLHANVVVPPRDRRRLERLCRYAARPPVASERLSRLADGRVVYKLRHRWRDGTTHVAFEPLELLEKLAALVPPPRANLVRYHGILAPAARYRSRVVPFASTTESEAREEKTGAEAQVSGSDLAPIDESSPKPRPRNYSWAELMRRVFEVDVLECPECGGAMRILAAIHPPEATRAILDCVGLASRPPPVRPPVPDTTLDLEAWF